MPPAKTDPRSHFTAEELALLDEHLSGITAAIKSNTSERTGRANVAVAPSVEAAADVVSPALTARVAELEAALSGIEVRLGALDGPTKGEIAVALKLARAALAKGA